MKKKLLTLILVGIMSISTIACGGSDSPESSDQKTNIEDSSTDTVKVEKELFDVTMTLPADFVGETTQEELDADATEYGYKVVLNDDGSVTYTMTKSQHKEFLADYKESLDTALREMVGSEDYPNFTDISANDNFTEFTITTKSTELDLNESFSVMAFYMYGGIYNIFAGEEVDNIHVDFVNADSGEIISSSDSKDMESSAETTEGSTKESSINLEDGIIDFEGSDYHVTYIKHEMSTDYEGNPCLLYYFTFTNNGEENSSAMVTSYIQCFQNGVECDVAITSDNNKEMDNYMKEIQPGTTIDVCTAFALEDNSEVTIEASDWVSMTGEKDIQTITLE